MPSQQLPRPSPPAEPTHPNITVDVLPEGLAFHIQPAGLKRHKGLLTIAVGCWISAGVVGILVARGRDAQAAPAAVAFLALSGGLFLIWAISLSRRRGTVELAGGQLRLSERGLVRHRKRVFPVGEIATVECAQSGIEIQGPELIRPPAPVMQLEIGTTGGGNFYCFRHRDSSELEWMAAKLRAAIAQCGSAVPQTGKDSATGPLERAYFNLTVFEEWNPGTRVVLCRRQLTTAEKVAGVVLVGVGWAVLGTILLLLAGAILLAAVGRSIDLVFGVGGSMNTGLSLPLVAALCAAVSAAMGWCVLSGAMSPREVVLDWGAGLLSVRTRRRTTQFPLSEVRQLQHRTVIGQVQIGSAEGSAEPHLPIVRDEYLARLEARIGTEDILLLETDEWAMDAEVPTSRLQPFMQSLAPALGVPLADEEPVRDPWDLVGFWSKPSRFLGNQLRVWREAAPLPRMLVRGSALLLAAAFSWQCLAGLQWCRTVAPLAAYGGRVVRKRATVAEIPVARLTDVTFAGTSLDDAALLQLKPSLQGCGPCRLNLAGTAVGDAGLQACAANPQLLALDLANTSVTDAGLAELAGCDHLLELNLFETAAADGAMASLADLPQLRILLLHGTQVTDAGVAHLQRCRSLKRVLLSVSLVSDTARERLQRAVPGLDIGRDAAH